MQETENHSPVSAFRARDVAKYALLPGVLPRLGRLATHFNNFLFMFTQLFATIGLIERSHPCLDPANIGRFRFGGIIMYAASNLRFSRQNIPQIVMFFAIILSLVLLVAMLFFGIAGFVLSAGTAHAQFFGQASGHGYTPSSDWAMQFLSRIFGMESFFGVHNPGGGNPWFTGLLTGMLRHYSMAMLVIAAFMVLYLLVVTLTEAARTGKPFGTRFDSIWAPIRLALAIGLMIPIAGPGYNGAQMLVLQSAKWGSNLATNVWFSGISTFDPNRGENFFSAAMYEPGYRFVRDMMLVNLCVKAIEVQQARRQITDIGKVQYRIVLGDSDYTTYTIGPIEAPDFCGEVKIMKPIGSNIRPPGLSGQTWPEYTTAQYEVIARKFLPIPSYGNILFGDAQVSAFMDSTGLITKMAEELLKENPEFESVMQIALKANGNRPAEAILNSGSGWVTAGYWKPLGRDPSKGAQGEFFETGRFAALVADYNKWLAAQLQQDAQHGWTSAGVFYIRISAAMSTISKVIDGVPRVTLLPSNLSKPFATPDNPRANTQQLTDMCNGTWAWFKKVVDSSFASLCEKAKLADKVNNLLHSAMNWFEKAPLEDNNDYNLVGGDAYRYHLAIPEEDTAANMSMGIVTDRIDGLFRGLRNKFTLSSNNMNPLGQVVSWGFDLLTIATLALGIGYIASGALQDIFLTIGSILMLPGFILAVWVPMLPFMYFTFAVIEWMISVLEAVIGMPLWALTLISLEGDGLGKGMDGVKMIFEIVLRPSIIVMSLIAAMLVFTAAVSYFNAAMGLYRGASAAQSGVTGSVGFILIYMFGIYSLATSSFKLIDAIPDNFGRWGGLPKGFGGSMKAGLSELGGLVMGGLVISAITSRISSSGKARSAKAQDKKDKLKAQEQADAQKNKGQNP